LATCGVLLRLCMLSISLQRINTIRYDRSTGTVHTYAKARQVTSVAIRIRILPFSLYKFVVLASLVYCCESKQMQTVFAEVDRLSTDVECDGVRRLEMDISLTITDVDSGHRSCQQVSRNFQHCTLYLRSLHANDETIN